jgi:hypothetical protein
MILVNNMFQRPAIEKFNSDSQYPPENVGYPHKNEPRDTSMSESDNVKASTGDLFIVILLLNS